MDKYTKDMVAVSGSPLLPIFALVAAEFERSQGLHRAWDKPEYTPEAMHKAVVAELAEADLAIALGYHTEAVREFVHTANTACKAALELLRRGEL